MSAAADTPADDYAIVIAGHGSRDPDGVAEFEALVDLVRAREPNRIVRHGYLEFATPTIDVAVEQAIAAGARHVVMVPGVLLAATHAKNDMPSELLALERQYPEIRFSFGAALDLHAKLLQLCAQRVIEAEGRAAQSSGETVPRSEACLVVVGRGTSDPDANSEISKLARMLEEGLGFGTSLTCYAGTAKPKVADGLAAAARLGYRRVVVLPYFLFDGILVKRIYAAAEELAARNPSLEILQASYLGPHTHVADVFIERAGQGALGRATMNCALCKYRVQIVGFEQQVGTPQRAHHLKVRGLSASTTASAPAADSATLTSGSASASVSATAASGTTVSRPPEASVASMASAAMLASTPPTAAADAAAALRLPAYVPHPIEAESMRIIDAGHDWSAYSPDDARVLKRIVHTSGDFNIVDDIYFSPGASVIGMRALLRCKRVITDVTMVQAGLKQALLRELGIETWCAVHDETTHVLAQTHNLTRSAAGIRRAWETFGNDVIVAIGDAPTAVMETIRLIETQGWRPQLVIGLPVGFVGTRECKQALRETMQVPRITNAGTRGGSPWAATVVNALMIGAIETIAAVSQEATSS
ncbi:precorrin-8X/cobalt-precorrin-8 methylmutase [Pararobbsia alpina]|uniref:precorrin-8X methylmutase n=1 Tax=Pararobbsia alpina TaxID=621374 RepID=UPI0039A77244